MQKQITCFDIRMKTALMRNRKAGYAQLELTVAAENTRAIALYEKEGFVEYGRNPRGFLSRTSGFKEVVYMLPELYKAILQFFHLQIGIQ